MILQLQPGQFERIIATHVITGGKPLVIEGWDDVLSKGLFNVKWLEEHYDKKRERMQS